MSRILVHFCILTNEKRVYYGHEEARGHNLARTKKIIIQNHGAKEREGTLASEPTKSGGGKRKKKIQNEEEMTSIDFNIALKLHMDLSILTFGKDLLHLSKQARAMWHL
nr:hypothetical protein [Tanacetum cinerariifolium]